MAQSCYIPRREKNKFTIFRPQLLGCCNFIMKFQKNYILLFGLQLNLAKSPWKIGWNIQEYHVTTCQYVVNAKFVEKLHTHVQQHEGCQSQARVVMNWVMTLSLQRQNESIPQKMFSYIYDLHNWVWGGMILANLEIDGRKVSLPKIHSNYFLAII